MLGKVGGIDMGKVRVLGALTGVRCVRWGIEKGKVHVLGVLKRGEVRYMIGKYLRLKTLRFKI